MLKHRKPVYLLLFFSTVPELRIPSQSPRQIVSTHCCTVKYLSQTIYIVFKINFVKIKPIYQFYMFTNSNENLHLYNGRPFRLKTLVIPSIHFLSIKKSAPIRRVRLPNLSWTTQNPVFENSSRVCEHTEIHPIHTYLRITRLSSINIGIEQCR